MRQAADLFPGFAEDVVDTGRAQIYVRHGGAGPPLLLLHGYPQTHAAWHRIAPALASRFSIVVPDVRGCGRSSCPPADLSHRAYSKDAMSRDILAIMDALGHRSFSVIGHGRGGCIAHRLAIDAAQRIDKLVAIDAIPASALWDQLQSFARPLALSWAFLSQPAPIPEIMIARDPAEWVESQLKRLSAGGSLSVFDERALDDYRRQQTNPERVRAMCEAFRACASIDYATELADLSSGKHVQCPTLVIWGERGALGELEHPLTYWKPWCGHVVGACIGAGHWIAEEAPAELAGELTAFLNGAAA